MIGSPDLLAFTGSGGFGQVEEEQEGQDLPEELSVPLVPLSNPWSSSAQFHRDFILVAEFSEQVGPKPVLTIPDDPRAIGSFDLNHFSVRIMSVDYQASGPGHAPPASPGPRLNFSEDSKVVLGDSAESAFAYVHHMTLYDLEARGMVRPFCMAYVCSDQGKLMENYGELSTCFSQAADSLKTGNRQAFSMELQRKLQELEFTRLTLMQDPACSKSANGHQEEEETEDELGAVERLISNHRDLLRQVTSYPNRKLKQPDFLPYDPADSLTDLSALMPLEPCPPFTFFSSTYCKSERELKPLQELCNSYFLSLMKEQLADTERRLRGDRGALRTAHLTRSLSRKLELVNFLFELWSPEDREEEERESAEAEQQRETGKKSGVEDFQSEPMSLESFSSCVEEISIKLEAVETKTVIPDPDVATEMAGSVSSGDSIEVLGTERSYRTQHVVSGSDNNRETPVGTVDTSYRRAAADPGVRRVHAYARRANSEDSIEVLSTTESIFPEDLTAITEEEAEHQPLSNGFECREDKEKESQSDDVVKAEKNVNPDTSANGDETEEEDVGVDGEESSKQTAVNGEILTQDEQVSECSKSDPIHKDEDPETTPKPLKEVVESRSPWSEVQRKSQPGPNLHMYFSPPVVTGEVEIWTRPGPPVRLLSVEEASDCTSFTGSSDPPSPTQNIYSNIQSHKRRRRKAGLRALRFLKLNSFSQHALFCLLSGRPLVVIGGDETLVRKMVGALSLFLPAPGPERSAVMPCLTAPLQLTDLLVWRLIGIHRSSSNSSSSILQSLPRYSRYLALLDLDQRTLHSPSYSGSLISRLANPDTGISRGITYLLHLESCLTALTNQALLYTFSPAARQKANAVERRSSAEKESSPATQGPCSSESDLKVIHFLSDLLSQHHAGRGPPVLRFSFSSVHLHRNTNTT
ncbi:guanine nucleotide exchange protein smcr8b [Xyrichtys novacula]|uniref:Guanine nucleotide exchange protein smcr8b n=1 Tax=Xyrichtys novacula TaxID=13765 RepID=A0AAV1EYX4_XYRNO|nr:guanine nucleotide exchange protein smcr8b [Xyrichtys novacula]